MRTSPRSLPLALTLLLPLAALAAPARAQDLDEQRLVDLVRDAAGNSRLGKRELAPEVSDPAELVNARLILRLLDARKITVHFDQTSFLECLDFVRDVTGMNIVVSPAVRRDLGDKPVSLRLRKVTLRSVLELLLGQVHADLRYGVRHGVLWLGLKEEAPRSYELEFYEVRDLLHRAPDFPGPKLGLDGLKDD